MEMQLAEEPGVNTCIDNDRVDRFVELDAEFHATVYALSRNERLAQMLSLLREQIQRFRMRTLANPGRRRIAFEEHYALVEALVRRDADDARRAAYNHIQSAESSLMSLVTGGESVDWESAH